jgi:thiol-disulfide isomerase/thioredoxin
MIKIVFVALFFIVPVTNMIAQDKKSGGDAQKDTTLQPYQKYPTLPAFNILLMDSVTIFNTYNIPEGKPIAIMLFSPDCKHCKRTIMALEAGMDSIKNVQFYLVTAAHNMADIREFYKEHHLNDYKNIQIVGRDYEFFFMSFYGVKFVPDIALYDEHKKLVKLIDNETKASEVYKYIH